MRRRFQLLLSTGIVLLGAVAGCLALLTQPFVAPLGSQPPQVDAKRLEAHVRHLSVDLHPRSFDQPRNLGLAAL